MPKKLRIAVYFLCVLTAVSPLCGAGAAQPLESFPDPYKIRSELLMEASREIGACSPEQAARVWAGGLVNRSGAQQYAVLAPELRDGYAEKLTRYNPNWVTGVSSPWVDSFHITHAQPNFDGTTRFELEFTLLTSWSPPEKAQATVQVAPCGNHYCIQEIKADKTLAPYMGVLAE